MRTKTKRMGTTTLNCPKRSAKRGGMMRKGRPTPLRTMVRVVAAVRGREREDWA
jgi:hypothetical protein